VCSSDLIEAAKTSGIGAGEDVITKTKSILFMDVSGWSKLTAPDIHAYASKGLIALKERLGGYDFINTWGDSVVATYDSAKIAAENALSIQIFFNNSYPASGVSSGLSCRVSLHVGEVIFCRNALLDKPDIFGAAVHVAARLEPVTKPGSIFCTKAFADRLKEVQGLAPKAWSLGSRELDKGFGLFEVFVLTGPNTPDPRALYAPLSSETSGIFICNNEPLSDRSEFKKYMGLLWKRTATGFEPRPYCPECPSHPVMSGFPPGSEDMWACPSDHTFDYSTEPTTF
jgi:class 3 adenylate cyclase